MTRQELQQKLIEKGVSPDIAKAAALRANQNGNTELSEAQLSTLADRLADASQGSAIEQTDSAFTNKFVTPHVDDVVGRKEGTKTGAGAAKEAADTATEQDNKVVDTLTQTFIDQARLAQLDKTPEEIKALVQEKLDAANGDMAQAEIAVTQAIGVERQVLEWLTKQTGRTVSASQVKQAMEFYNRRQPDERDRIKSLAEVMVRYGTDAMFTSVMQNATRSATVDSKYAVTDALGRTHLLDTPMVNAYQKTLGMSAMEGSFSTVLADAYSEWDKKASAGRKDAAEYGFEVLAPFITDALRSYAPEDDPDGYATLDAMFDSQSSVERYRAQLAGYGEANPLAALVALQDKALADKMTTVGLTDDETFTVQRLLKGVDPADLGLVGDKLVRYTIDYKKAQAGGGGGREIVLPDRNKIAEGFRELYRSWFKVDPADGELESLISDVTAQYVGAQQSNVSPDLASDMVARTRQTDLYQRLFAKKVGGASEEEYVGQFEGTARQLLGNEIADPSAIQAGMASGQVGTTVGAVAGSKQAFENTTFRDRLAQAAQLVSRMT